MLPPSARLSRQLFEMVGRSGRKYAGAYATLRVFQDTKRSLPAQFGFVVSSKTVKNATNRNRLKRRARHVAAKVRATLPAGSVYIFYFKSGAASLPFSRLEEAMNALIHESSHRSSI